MGADDHRHSEPTSEIPHPGPVEQVAEQMVELVHELESDRWDKVGIFLSTLCAVHCLAIPILMISLPLFAEKFGSPLVHMIMALFVVPVGLFAFLSGYRHHKDAKVVAIGFFGLALIAAGTLLPHTWIEFYEYDIVTIIGSLFLLTGHFMNRRACLCHPHGKHAH